MRCWEDCVTLFLFFSRPKAGRFCRGELRSPTGNNRPTGNYRPTRFWGFGGNLGYLGARDAPLRVFGGGWAHAMRPYGFLGGWAHAMRPYGVLGFFGVIWAHAMRPYGVLGFFGVIWAHAMRPYGFFGVIWAHAMRPYGFLGGWAHAMRPYGFWGNLGYLGARDAPLRVLDAAEGEKPPHQVNLDTFREKIFLHRESLK